jgi:hypothetical protein
MNGNGAYPDEMNEAIVFMDALRAAVPTQPDPRLERTLVPRLAATARASTLEAETATSRRATAPATRAARRPRSRFGLVARVGIAVALIPLVLAGLAVAGVTVPSAARSAFDSVGITLPNQPAKHAEETTTTTKQSSEGTAGAANTETPKSAPSKGKSAGAHQHALLQRQKAHGKAIGHERGQAIGLKDLIPPGHSGTTGAPAHSNAGGSSGSHSRSQSAHPTHVPKAAPTGHTRVPPGHSK